GDIPASYRFDFSATNYLDHGVEDYLALSSILDGVSDDVTIGNQGPLMQTSVRYYPHPGQTPADVRMLSAQWIMLDGGAFALPGVGTDGFQRSVYMTPAADTAVPMTVRLEAYPQPFDFITSYRKPVATSSQGETLGLRGGVTPGTITGHNDWEQRQIAA